MILGVSPLSRRAVYVGVHGLLVLTPFLCFLFSMFAVSTRNPDMSSSKLSGLGMDPSSSLQKSQYSTIQTKPEQYDMARCDAIKDNTT